MKPKFKTTQDGLIVIDPIEHCQCRLVTNTPVRPTPVSNDRIPYPMDSTVEITTDKLALQYSAGIFVRNPDGTLVTELKLNERTVLPRSEYILDISNNFKLYVGVTARIEVRVGRDEIEITFEEPSSTTISVRSHHTRPAETITVTDDPVEVMQAVSMFGSALKTTGPERSYPTLRGHPPAITLDDELNIPDSLSRPATGIRIEIPPTLRDTFVVAPLAYYLAAEVVPGSTPQLVTDSGFSYDLSGKNGFESTVEEVMIQVLLLDCIVRTEGATPLQLHERQEVENELEFDISSVYGQPIAKRIETYLEVAFETIRPQVPKWRNEIQFKPTAELVEFLPFAANDLLMVKISDRNHCPVPATQTAVQPAAGTVQTEPQHNISQDTGKGSELQGEYSTTIPTVQQFWRHNDEAEIESTRTLSSFRNGITQTPRDGPLEIEVICNDKDMDTELVNVHSSYNSYNKLPLNITVHHDLSTRELLTVLTKESDFVHYIGHINADGFRCSDGIVDAKSIETVGTKAFFLNACQSHEQGIGLIEAGSIGGIVTLTDIPNSTAVEAGSTIAQLLNAGLPLYAALNMLQKSQHSEKLYHILGEGTLSVSQSKSGDPLTAKIDISRKNADVSIISCLTSNSNIGGLIVPHIEPVGSYYLAPREINLPSVAKPQLIEFLNSDVFPLFLEGELRWSNEIKTSEL